VFFIDIIKILNLKSYIYLLDPKEFIQIPNTAPFERVSEKEVLVLDVIEIEDMYEYFLNLEGFRLIRYEDRLKEFPNIDDEFEEILDKLLSKYGKDRIIKNLERLDEKVREKALRII